MTKHLEAFLFYFKLQMYCSYWDTNTTMITSDFIGAPKQQNGSIIRGSWGVLTFPASPPLGETQKPRLIHSLNLIKESTTCVFIKWFSCCVTINERPHNHPQPVHLNKHVRRIKTGVRDCLRVCVVKCLCCFFLFFVFFYCDFWQIINKQSYFDYNCNK